MAHYRDKTFPPIGKTRPRKFGLDFCEFVVGKSPRREHDVSFGESQFPREDLLEEYLPDHKLLFPGSAEFRGEELYPRHSTPAASFEPRNFTLGITPELSPFRQPGQSSIIGKPDSYEFHPEHGRPKFSTPAHPIWTPQDSTPPFPELSPIEHPDFSASITEESPSHSESPTSTPIAAGDIAKLSFGRSASLSEESPSHSTSVTEIDSEFLTDPTGVPVLASTYVPPIEPVDFTFGLDISRIFLPGPPINPDYSRTILDSKRSSLMPELSPRAKDSEFLTDPTRLPLLASTYMQPKEPEDFTFGLDISKMYLPEPAVNPDYSRTTLATNRSSMMPELYPRAGSIGTPVSQTPGSPIQMHKHSSSQTPSDLLEMSSFAAAVPRIASTPFAALDPAKLSFGSEGISKISRSPIAMPAHSPSKTPVDSKKAPSITATFPEEVRIGQSGTSDDLYDTTLRAGLYPETAVSFPEEVRSGQSGTFDDLYDTTLRAGLYPGTADSFPEEIGGIEQSGISDDLYDTTLRAGLYPETADYFPEGALIGQSGTSDDLFDTTLRAGLYPEITSILSDEDGSGQPVSETLSSSQSYTSETEVKRPRTPSVEETASYISEEDVENDYLEVQKDIRDYEYMRKELNRILASFHEEGTFVEIQAPDRLARALKCIVEDLHGIAKEKQRQLPEPISEKSLKSNTEINLDCSLVVERSDILEFQEEAYALDEDLLRLSANVAVLYAQSAESVSQGAREIMNLRAEHEKLLLLNLSLKDKFKSEDSRYHHYLNLNIISYAKAISLNYDDFIDKGEERILHVMTRHMIDYALSYYPETMMPTEEIMGELFQNWAEWLESHKENPQEELDDINAIQNKVSTKNRDLYWRNVGYKIQYLEPLEAHLKEAQAVYDEECERSIKRMEYKQGRIEKTAEYVKQIHQLEALCELAAQYYVGFAEKWAFLLEQNHDARVLLGIKEPEIRYQRYGEMGTSFHSEDMPMAEVSSHYSDIELPSWLFDESPDRSGLGLNRSFSYPSGGISGSIAPSSSPSYVAQPLTESTLSPDVNVFMDIPSP